ASNVRSFRFSPTAAAFGTLKRSRFSRVAFEGNSGFKPGVWDEPTPDDSTSHLQCRCGSDAGHADGGHSASNPATRGCGPEALRRCLTTVLPRDNVCNAHARDARRRLQTLAGFYASPKGLWCQAAASEPPPSRSPEAFHRSRDASGTLASTAVAKSTP